MALTRSFKDTVKERATRDAEFRKSLLEESVECLLGGDIETGKSILRHYINATVGFEELGTLSGKSPKASCACLAAVEIPQPITFLKLFKRYRSGRV